jgi:hypothetical protein
LVKKACSFLPHGCCTLSHKYVLEVFNRWQGTQILFGVWTLSGIRVCFVARNKRGGWLSLRWFRTTN